MLCKTVRTPERFTYKMPDGKESKLWVYSFVDWMSYPNRGADFMGATTPIQTSR